MPMVAIGNYIRFLKSSGGRLSGPEDKFGLSFLMADMISPYGGVGGPEPLKIYRRVRICFDPLNGTFLH